MNSSQPEYFTNLVLPTLQAESPASCSHTFRVNGSRLARLTVEEDSNGKTAFKLELYVNGEFSLHWMSPQE